MVGGILSCGITHTLVCPLDIVKCRMQVGFLSILSYRFSILKNDRSLRHSFIIIYFLHYLEYQILILLFS